MTLGLSSTLMIFEGSPSHPVRQLLARDFLYCKT